MCHYDVVSTSMELYKTGTQMIDLVSERALCLSNAKKGYIRMKVPK